MDSETDKAPVCSVRTEQLCKSRIALLSLSIGIVDLNRSMGLICSFLFGPHNASGAATINDDGLTGHEARTVARQKECHLRNIVRKTGARYRLQAGITGRAFLDE